MQIDGQTVYDCADCLDSGYVAVVDPRQWAKGRISPVAVLCGCQAGRQRGEWRDNHEQNKVAWLTTRMVRFRPSMTREQCEAEIAETRAIERHPNYHPEFAAFSAPEPARQPVSLPQPVAVEGRSRAQRLPF